MRRLRGFSMIETMVVVAILAIVIGIAVPSLRTWIADMQVRTKAEAMLNGLQFARGEALRRNARIAFTLAADTSWVVGCETAVATDGDGDGVADCPSTIQSKPAAEAGAEGVSVSILPADADRATFNGVGMIVDNADGTATLATVDFASTSGGSRTYRVVLTTGGQSRICNPAETDATKPEKC